MKANHTKQRILAEGLALASMEGLEGTTLGLLAERTGLSKSGLYAHFRSKDSLQIEILQAAGAIAMKEVVTPAMQASPGVERLRTFFRHLVGWTTRDELPGGCPFVSACSEFDDKEGPMRDYIAHAISEWLAFLESNINEAIKRGDLRPGLDPAILAFQMCGLYFMHHTVSRLLRDPDADRKAFSAFEALLSSLH